jgi:hypothetical protein
MGMRVLRNNDKGRQLTDRAVQGMAVSAIILSVLLLAAACGTDTGSGEDGAGQGVRKAPTYVVWVESIPTGLDEGTIVLHYTDLDSGTDTELASDDEYGFHQPAVSGRVVVWVDEREDGRIFARDLVTGRERSVSDDHGIKPAVSGQWVVWELGKKLEGEWYYLIVAHNLASGVERTVELPEKPVSMVPTFSVSGDWLVWNRSIDVDQHWRDLNEIWGMRLSTGEQTLLRPKGTYYGPAVAGEWVLWRRSDSNRVEALDLRTRKVRLLPKGATTVTDGERVITVKGGQAAAQAGRSRMFVYDLRRRRLTPVPVAPGRFGSLGIHGEWVMWREPRGSLAPAPLRAVNYVTGETMTVADDAMDPSISRD